MSTFEVSHDLKIDEWKTTFILNGPVELRIRGQGKNFLQRMAVRLLCWALGVELTWETPVGDVPGLTLRAK